jgi:hypothetical protein
LANWLKQPAQRETVLQRQDAAAELAELIDFRQELQAEGRLPGIEAIPVKRLQEWLFSPSPFAGKEILPKLAWVLPPIALALITMWILGFVQWWIPSISLLGNMLINRMVWKSLRAEYQQTDRFANVLQSYGRLLGRIAGQPFASLRNQTLQAELKTEGRPAAEEIAQLAKILHRLELHMNGLVYFFVNTIFLWDIHALRALDEWKHGHAHKVGNWFAVLGEMEALAGIAAIRHAHTDWCIPVIREGAFLFPSPSRRPPPHSCAATHQQQN